jgi:hypothetical protein
LTQRNWFPPQASNGGRVDFGKAFDRPDGPKVFLALSELDVDSSRNMRVVVAAEHVDARGFTCKGETWADSILYTVGADWIAFG